MSVTGECLTKEQTTEEVGSILGTLSSVVGGESSFSFEFVQVIVSININPLPERGPLSKGQVV